ncbi:MAG: zinc-ribbon domain containing protein [Chloroflexota bacterium]|nr:zinc-ribbon domain containing protein [Chloroflexota bacterium]
MTDIQLDCSSCSSPFLLSAAERLFYAERGLHEPTMCPQCRARRRAERHSALQASVNDDASAQRLGTYGGFAPPPPRGGPDSGTRVTTRCSNCGGEAVVPFQPRPGRPVYCRKCYGSRVRRPA